MIYTASPLAIGIFCALVLAVLGFSYYLGAKAKSAAGYFAAHGQVHWFVNGVAFAGDYLSAASFLGICGMIAFYGYDGFLYSIGYLAGWIVALFVVAEPLRKLGTYTFADALDKKFNSRGVKLAAATSTLIVSLFYLIPQMVGAGALVKPLLGLSHWQGVLLVGIIVILIVTTAGMVSTTWVQFIKGSLLVAFCGLLTYFILQKGLRVENNPALLTTQTVSVVVKDGHRSTLVNGLPLGLGEGQGQLQTVGRITALPGGKTETGPLGPIEFIRTIGQSEIQLWKAGPKLTSTQADGSTVITTEYAARTVSGADVLQPGMSPTFSGLRQDNIWARLDFLSLMLALFAGTASLPHILIRYYTVKEPIDARKSTVVGIGAIGCFYILTLFLGLGAMTSGALDITNSNMAAPLLARTFGEWPFAVISAIAFTTVLGTVSGLIIAACGAVVHDLLTNLAKIPLSDEQKVLGGKITAVVVGLIAIGLGIAFENFNVTFLVGWAFNIAASANLPALIMLLFWKGTTKQGITVSIIFGVFSSLLWVLLSKDAYQSLWGLDPSTALMPFSQPGLVTIPLSFLVLILVSLATQPKAAGAAEAR